jgi:hypothetical protein
MALLAAPPPALHLPLLLMAVLLVATADNTNVSEAKAPSSPQLSSFSDDKTTANIKGFYKGMSREFVNEHNKVRARYGAGPLQWDKTLALYARRWANKVQSDCDKARHSEKVIYGECFFLGTNGTAKDALCSWEKEEGIYDRGTKECTPGHNFRDCGHFRIMVEKNWKWVGCGRAPCTQGPRLGQFFISCSYSDAKPNNTAAASTP